LIDKLPGCSLAVEVEMAIRVSQNSHSAKVGGIRGEGAELQERCLKAQDVERLAGVSRGDMIICTSGVLWLTQEGDPEDYMLRSGEHFVANRHGVVVVQAMSDKACLASKN
jgi:hypothetical protein